MDAMVTTHEGRPALMVNGQLDARPWASLDSPGDLAIEKLAMYAAAGVNTFIVTNSCKPYMFGWDGDRDDYDDYDGELRKVLRRMPDARLIVQVGARPGAPYPWCRAHPAELVHSPDGLVLHAPSLASTLWHEQSTDALRRLVAHFETSEFADCILGYIPIFGTVEWHGFGESGRDVPSRERKQAHGDYSQPMLKGFQRWMQRRHNSDVQALRDAWQQPNLTFDSIALPSEHQRSEPGAPARDYFTYYNELNADLAVAYCQAVRSSLREKKIIGLMHGYSFGWPASSPCPQGSGHVAVDRILGSDCVDFLLSPSHPAHQDLVAPRLSQHAVQSVLHAGKLHVHGIAAATHLKNGGDAKAVDEWDSRQLIRSDAAFALTTGSIICWMDYQEPIWGHWFTYHNWGPMTYDTPSLCDLMRSVGGWRSEGSDRTAIDGEAQIAVLVDPRGCLSQSTHDPSQVNVVEYVRGEVLTRIGAPCHDFHLRDWPQIASRYRLIVILNANASDTELVSRASHAGSVVVHADWTRPPDRVVDLDHVDCLRQAAEAAGVHRYTDQDAIVYAGRGMLAITSRSSQAIDVRLPHPTAVHDVETGRPVSAGSTAFTYPSKAGETLIFRLGPG